jgi:replication fork clamp-binding protein CrfC
LYIYVYIHVKVAGSNKAVSKEHLILRVHSKSVPNLTLVDLPGLTKVPVGDQPQNISEQIRTMVLEAIRNPNCIILAVSAANQDIANSDGLQIAREVDPDGHRTLGVLTKLDLMDQGTDAREVLGGKVYPLRHGYTAVVNRSQHDSKLPMREALKAEQAFFAKNPAYSALAHEQGIPFLSHRLNQILENHIRLQMPEIRKKVKYLPQVLCIVTFT